MKIGTRRRRGDPSLHFVAKNSGAAARLTRRGFARGGGALDRRPFRGDRLNCFRQLGTGGGVLQGKASTLARLPKGRGWKPRRHRRRHFTRGSFWR